MDRVKVSTRHRINQYAIALTLHSVLMTAVYRYSILLSVQWFDAVHRFQERVCSLQGPGAQISPKKLGLNYSKNS